MYRSPKLSILIHDQIGLDQVTVAVHLYVPWVRERLQCWLGSLLGARVVAGTEDETIFFANLDFVWPVIAHCLVELLPFANSCLLLQIIAQGLDITSD